MAAPYPERYPISLPWFHWVIGPPLALVRLALSITFLLVLAVFVAAVQVVTWITGQEPKRFRRFLARTAGKFLTGCFGGIIRREGDAPPEGSYLVANHLSWIDSLLFLGDLGAVFVVQARYEKWPLIGFLIRGLGNIYIDNKTLRDIKPTQEAIVKALDKGESIMFFPEGTTTDGVMEKTLEFRPALFEVAARAKLEVRCAAVDFSTSPGWPAANVLVAWADWTPFVWHAIRLMMSPWFVARVRYFEETLTGDDRKVLAKESRARIVEAL